MSDCERCGCPMRICDAPDDCGCKYSSLCHACREMFAALDKRAYWQGLEAERKRRKRVLGDGGNYLGG